MSHKKRGNKLGFLIFDFYLSMGIRHAYALLYFVSVYYLFFDRRIVKISSKYVRLRFKNPGFLKRIRHIYKLIVATGKNLIDLRQLEKRPEKVKFECDNEPIKKILSRKKGLIIMTAHMGNWQVMMRKLPDFGAKINIVMLPEENPAVSESLKIDHGTTYALNLIDPGKGVESVLEIMKELAEGNIVSIMGDRTTGDGKNISLDLFGEKIIFPKGPFLIAATANAPVILLLTRKKAPCSYALEMTDLAIDKKLENKDEKTAAIAEKYVAAIEEFLTRNPYAWNSTSMK